jgi:hypothetical protein
MEIFQFVSGSQIIEQFPNSSLSDIVKYIWDNCTESAKEMFEFGGIIRSASLTYLIINSDFTMRCGIYCIETFKVNHEIVTDPIELYNLLSESQFSLIYKSSV